MRSLSEEDIEAIVSAMEKRVTDKFYRDMGRGLWGLVWKAILSAMLVIAAYGAARYGQTP